MLTLAQAPAHEGDPPPNQRLTALIAVQALRISCASLGKPLPAAGLTGCSAWCRAGTQRVSSVTCDEVENLATSAFGHA